MVEIEEIAAVSQFDEIIREKCALIDFFAEWHMQCLTQAPIIEDVFEKFKGKLKVCRVNVDESGEIASRCNVGSLPSVLIFREGKEVCRMNGCFQQEEIEERISALLKL